MTIVERNTAVAYPPAAAPRQWAAASPFASISPVPRVSPARLHFVGGRGDYWRIMIRGAALQAVTLGIYRFWLFTDMRRFLWTNTEIDDESFEYTGTAIELLLGFLMAIGILIPIYALLFVASLELGVLARLSGVVAFLVLAGFGQYAAYRARRYRLTRTVWRGLRFHQAGSPYAYSLRAMLWSVAVAATLGLLYPWMEASLERYKMRHTFYGDLGGSFAETGSRLFRRGIILWALVVLPFAYMVAYAAMVIDWPAVGRAVALGNQTLVIDALRRIDSFTATGPFFLAGLTWSVLSAIILYPAFQAMVVRWWLSGIRLGGAAVTSDLRKRRFYAAYLQYILFVFLFSIVFFLVVGLIAGGFSWAVASNAIDLRTPSVARAAVTAGAGIVAYMMYVLACSTIYQVVVKLRLWQVAVESVVLSSLAELDHVHAGEATSSAVGEGLADALGGGAI